MFYARRGANIDRALSIRGPPPSTSSTSSVVDSDPRSPSSSGFRAPAAPAINQTQAKKRVMDRWPMKRIHVIPAGTYMEVWCVIGLAIPMANNTTDPWQDSAAHRILQAVGRHKVPNRETYQLDTKQWVPWTISNPPAPARQAGGQQSKHPRTSAGGGGYHVRKML